MPSNRQTKRQALSRHKHNNKGHLFRQTAAHKLTKGKQYLQVFGEIDNTVAYPVFRTMHAIDTHTQEK